MSFSKKLYRKRRKRNPNGLVSEHAQPGKIQSRYIDYSPLRNFSRRTPDVVVTQDCSVQLAGSGCSVSLGQVDVISRNEPTEPLKNMKKALHPRFVPSAPLLSHDPKYGGWIDPYEVRSKPKKKEKDYEYY